MREDMQYSYEHQAFVGGGRQYEQILINGKIVEQVIDDKRTIARNVRKYPPASRAARVAAALRSRARLKHVRI